MSLHETFFDDTAYPGLLGFFGDPGFYQAIGGGDPVACEFVVTTDVVIQPIAYDASTVKTGDVLEALNDVVGDITAGDTFTRTDDSAVFTAIKELENNGEVSKWVVQ